MPKKKTVVAEVRPETRTRRAASKEALKQMQKITKTEFDEPETLEIISDDEVIAVEIPPKKKYRLSHRKSSDGNDRDVLVLKTIGCDEETLKLEAWSEELSPVQLERQKKVQKEWEELNTKLEKLIRDAGTEVIYEGDTCMAYEVGKNTQPDVLFTQTQTTPLVQVAKNNGNTASIKLVMDPRSGVVLGTMTPTGSTVPAQLQTTAANPAAVKMSRKRIRTASNLSPVPQPPVKIHKAHSTSQVHQTRATEHTAVGGLTKATDKVVDLTSDESRSLPDSREVSFNKLQGKTFPSLVVVARPHLRVKDFTVDRVKLDAKVKQVLMFVPTKFAEWLIQQGVIRSEQNCSLHVTNKLKLGMYSDASKFPFSGGYVWVADCCPTRFVSVFSGSLFEGSPHSPSVLLKMIYHWACQTNVQNVVQWVKVDNLYVKGMNTWLRAICTVALHTYLPVLGGPGRKVEIGVISLGTTSQDGVQRQVKVEVLGILETDAKQIRLRAVEPLVDADRNYKKRFSKILEPLVQWVHPESMIVTDLTVDKATLQNIGFKHVHQSTSHDPTCSNHTIMEYLRRIVPRMFQNTLSLLSRQIIQQFLDELVWREWYGTTASDAFDNIILHLADQTRADTGQSLILRMNKVAINPFKNWSLKPFSSTSLKVPVIENNNTTLMKRQGYRNRKSKCLSPPLITTPDAARPPKSTSPDLPEQLVPLEHYYYGTLPGDPSKAKQKNVLNLKCPICKDPITNNIKLMEHMFTHAANTNGGTHQCHYCLNFFITAENLETHIGVAHPLDTRVGDAFVCIICDFRAPSRYLLGKHMAITHVPSELPYLCGTCLFRCSSQREAINHFYAWHDGGLTIQCPFCLKSTTLITNGRIITQNLTYFLQHISKHQRKIISKKCSKCSLWFVQKDYLKDHMANMHSSVKRKAGLVPWPVPRNIIMVPKSKLDVQAAEEQDVDLRFLNIDASDELKCRECEQTFNTNGHFPSLQSCSDNNCQYKTCCKNAMNIHHTIICKSKTLPVLGLPFKMFCVCGYGDTDGNAMAKHLAVCERKSAYPSTDAAKAARVTHSMLDVLGLVRRPEEPSTAVEIMEVDSDEESVKMEKQVEGAAEPKENLGVVEIPDEETKDKTSEADKEPHEEDEISEKADVNVDDKEEPHDQENTEDTTEEKEIGAKIENKEEEAATENKEEEAKTENKEEEAKIENKEEEATTENKEEEATTQNKEEEATIESMDTLEAVESDQDIIESSEPEDSEEILEQPLISVESSPKSDEITQKGDDAIMEDVSAVVEDESEACEESLAMQVDGSTELLDSSSAPSNSISCDAHVTD